ncbi:3767_t:CDS:2 [Ambispora gerdemannii]|uniref:3767_t:CDS:1 n=1 Tax=Ambispora gerdemannii TaxID=144530 RepID=A0A9N8VMH7_9GLOM|nr:3767_t:CDS:2 [Ambispora gerdemannii]
MSSINISEIAPFLVFALIMMLAEKIPVHLILAGMCFAIYVIRQQLTADLNARVETINNITVNYESLRDQLDHVTETGSIAPLRSAQFAGSSIPSISKRSLEEIASENGELSSKAQEMLRNFYMMINNSSVERYWTSTQVNEARKGSFNGSDQNIAMEHDTAINSFRTQIQERFNKHHLSSEEVSKRDAFFYPELFNVTASIILMDLDDEIDKFWLSPSEQPNRFAKIG